MAKPIVQFSAVSYDIGGHQGLRPQLVAKDAVVDLDLCREVVNERRLTTSAEELLHGFSSLADVAMKKVSEDGRPRAITKLIKFAPYATGSLESPSSPWNDSCKAIVRAVLLSDAKKSLDATFTNVTEGIGVKLNDVTWIGAKSVQNVLKAGNEFAANGNHMEFMEGDTAVLKIGEIEYPLECTESDVSHAHFAYPEELEDVESGTQATFIMKSRGGVVGGQVYTTKKVITIIEGLVIPKLVSFTQLNAAGNVESEGLLTNLYSKIEIKAKHIPEGVKGRYAVYSKSTGELLADTKWDPNPLDTTFERVSDTLIRAEFKRNSTVEPDGAWYEVGNPVKFELLLPDGTIIALDIPYDVH